MISHNIRLLVLNAVLHCALTQRRITGGKVVDVPKRYVVYLVRAPSSPKQYDAWLCGGALVSTTFIVTSAACIEDVQHMYAIAGYHKLVRTQDLDGDECTKAMKKKVVFTCVPKAYDFDYTIEKWANIDIAAIKVESPYNFEDASWLQLCSYKPEVIQINYEPKNQEPGVDAMVLGWGHLDKWRKPEDTSNYNQDFLHYAATRIHDKNECKKSFTDIPEMTGFIDKYMICTIGAGNIDDKGDLILKSKPIADGCTPKMDQFLRGNIVCAEDEPSDYEEYRKTFSKILMRQQNVTRRQGICQNDHGGPLVTWVGAHEVLIGVASVFRITTDSSCTGPYLYTSTQCNGAFLDCVINDPAGGQYNTSSPATNDGQRRDSDDLTRRAICDKPPSERGFHKIERNISWLDHPEGPAENERWQIRPQVPLNALLQHLYNGNREP